MRNHQRLFGENKVRLCKYISDENNGSLENNTSTSNSSSSSNISTPADNTTSVSNIQPLIIQILVVTQTVQAPLET